MKLLNPLQNFITVVTLLVCASCSNTSLSRSNIERAKIHQTKGRYEKAIELASTPAAYREDSKEASRIVSESTKAQMLKDIDLIWAGELSDEEAKKKGYYIARCRFDGSEYKEKK